MLSWNKGLLGLIRKKYSYGKIATKPWYLFFLVTTVILLSSSLFIFNNFVKIPSTVRAEEAVSAIATDAKEEGIVAGEITEEPSASDSCIRNEYYVVVNVTTNHEDIFQGDPGCKTGKIVESYPIASGAHEMEKSLDTGEETWSATPTGKWRISEKTPSSGQFGPWFLRLENLDGHLYEGFALHGTDEPNSIGKWASHGCIRHYNKDIEHINSILPVGTTVWTVE